MGAMQVNSRMRLLVTLVLAILCTGCSVTAWNAEYTIENSGQRSDSWFREEDIVTLGHARARRQASAPSPAAPVPDPATTTPAADADKNKTNNQTAATPAPAAVTRIPLLGVNGSGIRKDLAANTPLVSDPILPDENITDIIRDMPETIKAEHNLTNVEYDDHNFYNSTFIGNKTYFEEHWANITKPPGVTHAILSNSHRRATTLKLTFEFPFYGHPLRNITVASGGFIYTGDHVHYWLAATQYIAPLMANFDNRLTNDSAVRLFDDGEKFTALWENVTLLEDSSKNFTFAATLYKNGDITFAYRNIPVPVQDINEDSHPVKVGISDAYQSEKIMFFVRRKTIYEYHRVSFRDHEIASQTILKLVALPTCVQYNTCATCVNHETGFNCSWCEQIQKCSSGTDRNKQDWMMRHCDATPYTEEKSCPAPPAASAGNQTDSTAYFTDNRGSYYDPVIRTGPVPGSYAPRAKPAPAVPAAAAAAAAGAAPPADARSPVGGVVAALAVTLAITGAAAWLLYAFKNPHTKSGQMLIKYRPTQWSWKRGEARYTAATIHM